jgi:heptosyltransferase-1
MVRILIIKTSSLGDIVHCLPVINDIKYFVPESSIDWLVEECFADVPRLHPGVDSVITISLRTWKKNLRKKSTWIGLYKSIKAIRENHYDIIIDFQGLLKSAFFTLFTRGDIHGFDKTSIREGAASYFYKFTHTVSKQIHAVVRNRELASKCFQYELLDQSAHFGLEIHNINNFNLSERYVVLIHGSSKKSKQWPKEHWLKVIQFFNGLGLRVLLPWGNLEEYHFSKALRKASTNSLVLPKMNISDLANVISGAKCIIGVDSGLTHLGNAVGIPTIGLYMDSNPYLTGVYPNIKVPSVNRGEIGVTPTPESTISQIEAII